MIGVDRNRQVERVVEQRAEGLAPVAASAHGEGTEGFPPLAGSPNLLGEPIRATREFSSLCPDSATVMCKQVG